jgi:mannose-6-phosphate isomerase-like protein (cupin superfamily)
MSCQSGLCKASNGEEREMVQYLEALMSVLQAFDAVPFPTDSVAEHLVPAKASIFTCEPRDEDAAFYVIEGKATFHCREMTVEAAPGTFLFLPYPVGFGCTVSPSGSLRILSWTMPLGLAQRATGLAPGGEALVLSPPPTFAGEKIRQLAALLRAYLKRGSSPA